MGQSRIKYGGRIETQKKSAFLWDSFPKYECELNEDSQNATNIDCKAKKKLRFIRRNLHPLKIMSVVMSENNSHRRTNRSRS